MPGWGRRSCSGPGCRRMAGRRCCRSPLGAVLILLAAMAGLRPARPGHRAGGVPAPADALLDQPVDLPRRGGRLHRLRALPPMPTARRPRRWPSGPVAWVAAGPAAADDAAAARPRQLVAPDGADHGHRRFAVPGKLRRPAADLRLRPALLPATSGQPAPTPPARSGWDQHPDLRPSSLVLMGDSDLYGDPHQDRQGDPGGFL